jgi:hypothetical protein
VKLGTEQIDEATFRDLFSAELEKLHGELFEIGIKSGGGVLDATELANWTAFIRDTEQQFIQGLAIDLAGGRYLDDEDVFDAAHGSLVQRIQMYASKSSYSATKGFMNGSTSDEEFDWDLGGVVEDHCADCPYLASGSPYTAATLYAVPRDCSTQCRGNCKCVLVRRSDGVSSFGPVNW